MTKQAERIFQAIDNREKRLSLLCNNPDEKDEISAIEMEIKELESEICAACGGEGTVVNSYFASNPYLITPPEIDCHTCKGTGVN